MKSPHNKSVQLTHASAFLSFLMALITSFFAWPEITALFVVIGYYFSYI